MGVSLSLFVFLSLLTGAGITILISKWLKLKVDYILSLCAGILCGLLFLELIPHSFSFYSPTPLVLGIGIGLLFMYMFDHLIHKHSRIEGLDKTPLFYFLILAITLHNVPTGLALGNHLDHQGHLFHTVVFHHIPEGMTLMMIYIASSIKKRQLIISFVYLCLSLNGFALLGSLFPISDFQSLAVLLGISIGTIGYVAIFELYFSTLKNGYKPFHLLSLLAGIFIIGVILLIG